jgi:hypothetical protein
MHHHAGFIHRQVFILKTISAQCFSNLIGTGGGTRTVTLVAPVLTRLFRSGGSSETICDQPDPGTKRLKPTNLSALKFFIK